MSEHLYSSHKQIAIELLAPARNADIAREAILHGADAVYIGAESFGARAAPAIPSTISNACVISPPNTVRKYMSQ